MSLLRRLAGVGLGRREEDPPGAGSPARAPGRAPGGRAAPSRRSVGRSPPPPRAPNRRQRRARQPEPSSTGRAQGDLDPHGRPQPATRPQDDELEIPAFLRRQAN